MAVAGHLLEGDINFHDLKAVSTVKITAP